MRGRMEVIKSRVEEKVFKGKNLYGVKEPVFERRRKS